MEGGEGARLGKRYFREDSYHDGTRGSILPRKHWTPGLYFHQMFGTFVSPEHCVDYQLLENVFILILASEGSAVYTVFV